jgi:hypothetical protein
MGRANVSGHSDFRKFISRLAVIAILAIGISAMIGGAFATHDLGLFELDGNATDDPDGPPADPDFGGPDWDTILGKATPPAGDDPLPSSPATIFIGEDKESLANDVTYFHGGGSKDINDIPDWRYGATPSAPDKNQITNAYAYASFEGDDVILYFGADRYSNDGDSAIGFWFFQDAVSTSDRQSKGGYEFNGSHTENDVFVVSDFTNGGVVENLAVYLWKGPGNLELATTIVPNPGTDCAGSSSPDDGCAAVNAEGIPAPWPYTPKANIGDPGTIPPLAFFEGGVNLTALLGPDGVGCFSSFLAETRSSQEQTAQLKDLALGQFEICDANISIAPDAVNEVGTAHTFTVTVNKEVAGTEMPAAGTEVTVDFTVVGADAQTPNPATCTTDSNGECTVAVNSTTAGDITAHASANVEVLPGDLVPVETDGLGDNSGDAVKHYVDASVSIAADGVNEVGNSHTFTVTVTPDYPAGTSIDWVTI